MPPFILIVLGVAGGAALLRLATKESRRVNRELDEARRRQMDEGGGVPLRRDPQTGAFRPH